ncbi:MAG: NADH-quinone oxidoreductase subunit N [Planctomycetes bacterium]|nr:NADH-quinone oxidoreductase subunit N [Planctomycetota bacterium]
MSEIIFLLAPMICMAIGGLVTLVAEPFISQTEHKHTALPWIACMAVLAAMTFAWSMCSVEVAVHIHGMFIFDSIRAWLDIALFLSVACGIVSLQHSLRKDEYPGGEAYALMLLSSVGVSLMIHAVDTLALFVALELASLPIYALVGLRRHRADSVEGLLKYFIMGAIFSAIFLYGAALTFGATGYTQFGHLAIEGREALLAAGYGLMIIALMFKTGDAPFHFWSPDAYVAAPLGVTTYMASAMKIGGFAALGSLWVFHAGSYETAGIASPIIIKWSQAFLVLGVLSIALGNFSALGQCSLRRIMAFSSVAHAGYMLLAFPLMAGEHASLQHLTMYLVSYAVASACVFAACTLISGKEDEDKLDHLSGLARRHPFAGLAMTLGLTSLAGVPLTAGFLGKYMIFHHLVLDQHVAVAIIGMLMAVVGAVYYFRIVITIWQPKEVGDGIRQRTSGLAYFCVSCAALSIFLLLLVPNL